jgi:undecaprenyl-diphosphatase
MNSFDTYFALFFNQFVRHSRVFDRIAIELAENHLFKGGVLVSLLFWAIFRDQRDIDKKNNLLVSIFIASFLAEIITKVIPKYTLFRFRPLYEPSLHLNNPYGLAQNYLDSWSSFPSDHAAIFFAFSACIYFTYNKIGRVAIIYTAIFIALPRLYLGLHYPTDILAGACIGFFAAAISCSYLAETKTIKKIVSFGVSKPALFYPILLFFYFQVFEMFESIRRLLILLSHIRHVLI